MYPVLVDFGAIKIYSFGTFIVLAFIASAFYVRRRAARDLSLDRVEVFNLCFALLFIGLIGARLLYAIVKYDEFSRDKMKIFKVWEGGLVWYGGLIFCLLWLAWYLPRHPKLKGWALADLLALGTSLGLFIGRWASFLSGENYGKVAPDLPWAVVFPPHADTQALPLIELHPAQLYHSLHGLVMFLLLAWYMRSKPAPGRVLGLFLMLYAIGRSVTEIWRGDDAARGMVIDGWVSTSQLISIPIFFIGTAIFLSRGNRDEKLEATMPS